MESSRVHTLADVVRKLRLAPTEEDLIVEPLAKADVESEVAVASDQYETPLLLLFQLNLGALLHQLLGPDRLSLQHCLVEEFRTSAVFPGRRSRAIWASSRR